MSTPILPFAVWASGTNQNSIPANDNSLRNQILNGLVIGVEDDAPGGDADGDIYIVGDTPAGAFAAFDEFDLAIYMDGTWYAFAPTVGVVVNVAGALKRWDGSAYVSAGGGAVDSVNGKTGAVSLALGDLSDVSASSPTTTYVLTWNGSVWVPAAPSGGMSNPMTTGGDMIVGGASGTPTRVAAGTDGHVWTMVAGVPAWAAPTSGGGLTNWADGLNSSSPNATVPVASLTASNAATNVDAALVAKGSGATTAQVADGTSAGGNKRGAGATDWQKSRTAAAQVASGNYSSIGGGRNITATGQGAAVGGGEAITASGANSTAGGGSGNTSSNTGSTVGGGIGNTSSGTYSTVPGGRNNVASGADSVAMGYMASTRSIAGAVARASGGLGNSAGDGQSMSLVLDTYTSNTTPTVLKSDSAGAGVNNQYRLENGSSAVVRGSVVARVPAGDSAMFDFVACIKRGANAASTTMVTACTPTVLAADAGASTWAITVDADTTNGCLRVSAVGESGKGIYWVCDLYSIVEVKL